jgi:hypothetical protein
VAQEPSCFLSVMWHGEAFHRLGVKGVKVLVLLAALFPPSVAPASQQGFGVMELTLCASAPLLPYWILNRRHYALQSTLGTVHHLINTMTLVLSPPFYT